MSDVHDHSSEPRHIIAWSDVAAQPWRNGGGVTRQILSMRLVGSGNWMPAADDDWDWRLSIANVDSAGAFSSFPGMTRILTVIEGTSVTLTVDGTAEELESHRPFRFDGGAVTSAQLTHGPIRDLNVIARTGTVDATVSVETVTADNPRPVYEGQYCVLLEGHALLSRHSAGVDTFRVAEVALEPFDTVVGDTRPLPTIHGDGILAVITISASE